MTLPDDILLQRARVFILGRRGVLSLFEADTIRQADARVRAGLGVISAAERQVIQDALEAMQAAGAAA